MIWQFNNDNIESKEEYYEEGWFSIKGDLDDFIFYNPHDKEE